MRSWPVLRREIRFYHDRNAEIRFKYHSEQSLKTLCPLFGSQRLAITSSWIFNLRFLCFRLRTLAALHSIASQHILSLLITAVNAALVWRQMGSTITVLVHIVDSFYLLPFDSSLRLHLARILLMVVIGRDSSNDPFEFWWWGGPQENKSDREKLPHELGLYNVDGGYFPSIWIWMTELMVANFPRFELRRHPYGRKY